MPALQPERRMQPSDQQSQSVLEVSHLCKSFAGLTAVDDVSFVVRTGDILGLIGPNGSGKTTLINVITGLLPASSGTVHVDGHRTTKRAPHRVAKAGIARTFQTIRLFRELTVMENVEVAAVSMGRPRRKAVHVARTLLDDLGLSELAGVLAAEIPFGHQRKLAMARALAMSPKVRVL
ncbi:ATP-binding cassette domain-containing protein, partial [bacterium]|nr:ATP-binding cassette domain-containing protein [bacterium]